MTAINFEKDFSLENNTLAFIWVNPGKFLMGSTTPSLDPFNELSCYNNPFECVVTQGYWLMKYPVTYGNWKNMGFSKLSYILTDETPVYNISWFDAIRFCQKMNKVFTDELPPGYHFNLPTEVHWEYACKAGTGKDYLSFTADDMLKLSNEDVGEIGNSTMNAWGFHNMIGLLREWCFDIAANYPNWKVKDWMGNIEKEDWVFGNEIQGDKYALYRILRGAFIQGYREALKADSISLWEKFPLRPGFRVCLRPITEYDLDDPVLKKEGINLLG